LRQSSPREVSRNNLNLFIINFLRKEADMAITKVRIDEDECTQCGLCEDTCPEVFEMGDDSAIVKAGVDFNTYEDAIREAAEDCPSEAILVE
jgi:ferredoxin